MCSVVNKVSVKGLIDLEIRGRIETIQTTALLKIGQNTEKSPGGLMRFSVIQTSATAVKTSQRSMNKHLFK